MIERNKSINKKLIFFLLILILSFFNKFQTFAFDPNSEVTVEHTDISDRIYNMSFFWKKNFFQTWTTFMPTTIFWEKEWNNYLFIWFEGNRLNLRKNSCESFLFKNKYLVTKIWKFKNEEWKTYYQCITKKNENNYKPTYIKNLYNWIPVWNKSIEDSIKKDFIKLNLIRRWIWRWINENTESFYLINNKKFLKNWVYNLFFVKQDKTNKTWYIPICWIINWNNSSDWLCTQNDIDKLNNIPLTVNLTYYWVPWSYFNTNRITENKYTHKIMYSWPAYYYDKSKWDYKEENVKNI